MAGGAAVRQPPDEPAAGHVAAIASSWSFGRGSSRRQQTTVDMFGRCCQMRSPWASKLSGRVTPSGLCWITGMWRVLCLAAEGQSRKKGARSRRAGELEPERSAGRLDDQREAQEGTALTLHRDELGEVRKNRAPDAATQANALLDLDALDH